MSQQDTLGVDDLPAPDSGVGLDDLPAPPDIVTIGGQKVNLRTGEGGEKAAQAEASGTQRNVLRQAHGAVSLMGRPESSQAADESFDAALKMQPHPWRGSIVPFADQSPVVPKGMEDMAETAGKIRQEAGTLALGEGALEAGVAGKLVPFAKRAATSLVGGAAGAEAGKYGGRWLGGPAGGQIGQVVGGLAGGLAGGGAFGEKARTIGNPSEIPIIGKYLPDLLKSGETSPEAIPAAAPAMETPEAMPSVRPSLPERIAAQRMQTPRRLPGEIAPETTSRIPEVNAPMGAAHGLFDLPGGGGTMNAGPAGLLPERAASALQREGIPQVGEAYSPETKFGASGVGKTTKALDVLENLLNQQTGGKPLEPNVPLGQQRNAGGQVTWRRQPVVTANIPGETPTAKAPERIPTVMTEEPARQMGAPPLNPNVPLREQLAPKPGETPYISEQARLEEKYKDKAIRQMVHANGEEIVDATGDDKDTLKAIHDLTNPDVRQALINSGEDMGQRNVSNRKASGDLSRQDAFRRLLAKGVTPKQILELAKPPVKSAVLR